MLLNLNGGDLTAAEPLWERYFARLVGLARVRLLASRRPGTVVDEEDVALSAFANFVELAAKGRFPKLDSRDDLWRLLVVITARKAAGRWRSWKRREGRQVVFDEQALFGVESNEEFAGLGQVIGAEPTADFAAQLTEEFERLIDALKEKDREKDREKCLAQIALMRMEGYTALEIADRVGCARETVFRRIDLIKKIWIEAGLVPLPGVSGRLPGETDAAPPVAGSRRPGGVG
jgi:DNA-directed RNA polymerase specialized sigma24 family protein